MAVGGVLSMEVAVDWDLWSVSDFGIHPIISSYFSCQLVKKKLS
jgi:hypothetical protein